MLSLGDEIWLAENASFLCFGAISLADVMARVGELGRTRIFLEVLSAMHTVHLELVRSNQITVTESNAMRNYFLDYIRTEWRTSTVPVGAPLGL